MPRSKYPENCCYKGKHFSIGYDRLQWIKKTGENYDYYPTMEMLLTDGLEYETREVVGTDIKDLLTAIERAQENLKEAARNIKIPGGKYGN